MSKINNMLLLFDKNRKIESGKKENIKTDKPKPTNLNSTNQSHDSSETKNNITCEIENIELDLDDINIEIINTPKDDYYSLADKTIIFEDFEGKKINTLIAGKIEDIGCNSNIYTFAFNNSKSQIKLEKEFYLKMENPSERKAKCNVNSNSNTEILLYDIICIIEGSTTCPIDIGTNIIVANEEPEPIEINDTTILYLSSF